MLVSNSELFSFSSTNIEDVVIILIAVMENTQEVYRESITRISNHTLKYLAESTLLLFIEPKYGQIHFCDFYNQNLTKST